MRVDDLIEQLGNDDRELRTAAIESLRAGLPSTRDAAVDALSDPRWLVRASAAAVLDHAEQDAELEQALIRAAHDVDARVRTSALHSLSCGDCKPDGCVSGEALDLLVEAMLHDSSVRLRRKVAGGLMWGQHGRPALVTDAFGHILDTSTDRVLRQRAATYLASCDLPRKSMPYREWIGPWRLRIDELLVLHSPAS